VLRRVAAALALTLAVAGMTLLAAAPSSAAKVCKAWVTTSEGRVEYTVVPCPGEGDDGGTGGSGSDSGSSGPSCYLGRQAAFDYDNAFCKGDLSCYDFVPSPSYEEDSWPDRPAGTDDDAVYSSRACFTQPPAEDLVSFDYLWITPDDGPTLAEQADEAFGALDAPSFTLAFNPPTRAVVGVPTWFWAQGATGGALHGSSAAGLVAVATPDHMDVDAGDGSGVRACAFSVAQSDTCSTTYMRSSAGRSTRTSAGDPAYDARMRLVYSVQFLQGGKPISIPGAPTQFSSGWQDALVPVAEVQSVVTG